MVKKITSYAVIPFQIPSLDRWLLLPVIAPPRFRNPYPNSSSLLVFRFWSNTTLTVFDS